MKRSSIIPAATIFAPAFLAILLGASPAWAGGKKDAGGGERVRAAVFKADEARILAAYIVDDVGLTAGGANKASAKTYAEGMYVPQAAAAYFPTGFAITGKERRLDFNDELAYRVLSKSDLGGGVLVYTVEASGRAAESGDGRRYSVSFPRSALGGEGKAAIQPAPYALERAARMSGLSSGLVRLESLRYDADACLFKATAVAGPHSTIR
jgi:hypothetical protein